MAPTNLRRTIAPAVFAAAFLSLASAHPLNAQVQRADSAGIGALTKRYFEEVEAHPDSGLATLHAMLSHPSATIEDTIRVSQFALTEGNMLYTVMNNSHPRLDSLTLARLGTHEDSLGMAISYLSLSDSTRASPGAGSLLLATYFDRTFTREAVARRTDRCGDWRAFHDDAARLQAYALRTPNDVFQLLKTFQRRPRPNTPASLLEYADSLVGARCS